MFSWAVFRKLRERQRSSAMRPCRGRNERASKGAKASGLSTKDLSMTFGLSSLSATRRPACYERLPQAVDICGHSERSKADMKAFAGRKQLYPPQQYERLSMRKYVDLGHRLRVHLVYERSKIVDPVSCDCQGFCSDS
jgi:hypothetical protein